MACDQTEEIARLTQAFHDMDKDHDGVIDISELESAFGAVFKKAGQPVNEADIKRQCAVRNYYLLFIFIYFLF